ncbi:MULTISPECIES: molecular chaperone [Stenotrophomonas]|uniref:Pilus assembly protein n=1 Tax=Stenotrophomonas maltophilia TaxID=40324 RepID=A0A2J0U6X6_STEMA|nr:MULTISPECIES: fimbria/pilus periplasmic chaperone [Stenotrophomonas]PJL24714.1 hypothetical protein B9Y64_19350 [Stenotrophomonas maltophilia]HDS1149149.1 fimbria/pilus periplasmic chaperone [Stenotrophomonas maltophilia]HDS1162181.1 fimbria/pilus periplasmic chaperone [Stenotrophomonas maltophilia]
MSLLIRAAATGLALLSAALYIPAAAAQVTVEGTRVIFPGSQSEVSLRLQNGPKGPVLVQVWLDDGDSDSTPETASAPFVVRPPLFRLEGGKSQVIRIHFTGAPLPQDRESLYWINVLEIPPKPSAGAASSNYLQLSGRTRLKVLYRPKGLDARGAADAPRQLEWSLVSQTGNGYALQAYNPTPYYVNFSSVGLRSGGTTYSHGGIGLVAPGDTAQFPLQGLSTRPSGSANVQFRYVNDQSGVRAMSMPLHTP